MRPVVSASEATRRLLVIFPRTAFDTVMSSPLAGAAVAALIYVDAVAATNLPETFWARPSMVTWMSEDMRARGSEEDRRDWRTAASKKKAEPRRASDFVGSRQRHRLCRQLTRDAAG
jgi:hypothetical protein